MFSHAPAKVYNLVQTVAIMLFTHEINKPGMPFEMVDELGPIF